MLTLTTFYIHTAVHKHDKYDKHDYNQSVSVMGAVAYNYKVESK